MSCLEYPTHPSIIPGTSQWRYAQSAAFIVMTVLYCHYVRIVSQWINKARLHCALMPKKTAVLRCRTVLVYSPVTINILQRGFHAINTTQTKLFFPMKDPTGKLVCHRILFRGTSRVGNYYHCENSEPAYRTRLFPSCLTV